ncbi:Kinesin light chain [Arachis hypogaea]|nr:Kinesin light chain [Arachis hypogaea]
MLKRLKLSSRLLDPLVPLTFSFHLPSRCLNARKVLLPNDHIQIGANLLRLAQVAMLDSSQHKKFDVKKVKAELDIAKDHVHNSIRFLSVCYT